MIKFADRFKTALEIKGITATELSKRTGIPQSAISQYKSSSFKPRLDRVEIIADALGVDPAWLLGYEVSDPEIMDVYSSLTDLNKKQVVNYALYLLAMQEEQNGTQE